MAQTTTAQNACDAVIQLDTDAGALTDISGASNQVGLSFTLIVGEQRTFNGEWPVRLTCGKDASITLSVLYTTTADEGWDLLKGWWQVYDGAARTIRIDMPDNSAGSDRIQGEVLLTEMSYDLVAGEGAPVLVSATLLPTGELPITEIGT